MGGVQQHDVMRLYGHNRVETREIEEESATNRESSQSVILPHSH